MYKRQRGRRVVGGLRPRDALDRAVPELLRVLRQLLLRRIGEKRRDLRAARGNGAERDCLLYTSPSPRDRTRYRMPSSA